MKIAVVEICDDIISNIVSDEFLEVEENVYTRNLFIRD